MFAADRIAGILAAKCCDELIPLCHSMPLDGAVVAALSICDMVKAIDRIVIITNIRFTGKSRGKSGHFIRKEQPCRDK